MVKNSNNVGSDNGELDGTKEQLCQERDGKMEEINSFHYTTQLLRCVG